MFVEICLFILLFFILLYFYGIKYYDHFDNKGVKCYKPKVPFLGHSLLFLLGKEPFTEMIERFYKMFPNESFIGAFDFKDPVIWLRDPEIIKQVTIKDFDHFMDHRDPFTDSMDPLFTNNLFNLQGQKWKEMRNTLTPAFTSSKMRNMFQFMVECSNQLTQNIEEHVNEASEKKILAQFEMKEMFSRYTNDVIASNAFGLKIDSFKDKNNEFYKTGNEMANPSARIFLKFFLFLLMPKVMKLLKIDLMQKHIAAFFKNIILQTMKIREEQNIYRPDMIHLLMEAKKGSLHDDEAPEKMTKISSRVWTDDELVSQAFIFFIAGFESVSSLLSLASYELAAHKDIQETLINEVDQVLASEEGLTYDKLMKMPFMDQFVSETLRLWPSAPGVDRKCVKDYDLLLKNDTPNTKYYKMKKGQLLFIPIYSIHRDPKNFPDPQKFDPSRFSEERKHLMNTNAFMPFGIGPRQCIGNRFALMEIKVVIFCILSKFKIIPCEKTVDPETSPKKPFNVLPKAGIWVGIIKR